MPRIKVGLAAIKAGDMAALQAIAEDMITAMKLYGQAQRKGEVPDKISETSLLPKHLQFSCATLDIWLF